jgi:glycosyltransferase involved in cell wall biosynthesis
MTTTAAPVTVIIPAFNCRQWIGQAIDGPLGQSVRPAQVIVVDDGSTDDTADVLAAYGGRIRCLSQANQGVAAARNRGLAAADTEWIAFLDADDVWHPRKLELQMGAIARCPELGLLGTGLFAWPAAAMPPVGANAPSSATRIGREQLAVRNCLATSSVVVRHDVVRRVGDFDTTLSGPEDHDYWLRAAEVTPVGVLPVELTGYRTVPGSLSKRATSMEAGMKRILHKLDARDFWRGDRLLRRRAYSYASYSCAYMHGAAGDHAAAVRRLVESLTWCPWPSRAAAGGVPLGRARRLAVSTLRMIGVMNPDPNR